MPGPFLLDVFSGWGYEPQLGIRGSQKLIYDGYRHQYVPLTPEEWVRQHLLWYLVHGRGYSANLCAVERAVRVNGAIQRADLLFYDRQAQPYLLVETKAERVPLSQGVCQQVARYNGTLGARYAAVSNGMYHLVWTQGNEGTLLLESYPAAP